MPPFLAMSAAIARAMSPV